MHSLTCLLCSTPLDRARRGRPRAFCSAACKGLAKLHRRQARSELAYADWWGRQAAIRAGPRADEARRVEAECRRRAAALLAGIT
jgi:hypothetical protein